MTLSEAAKLLNIPVSNLSSRLSHIGFSVSKPEDVISDFIISSINKKLQYSIKLPLSTDTVNWWDCVFDGTKIFIDTCAYLADENAFPVFLKRAIPFLQKYNNRFFIPIAVKSELEKKANQHNNKVLRDTAKSIIKHIESYSKFFRMQGDKNETFADNVFLSVFTIVIQIYILLIFNILFNTLYLCKYFFRF